jgi:hypothetical protein
MVAEEALEIIVDLLSKAGPKCDDITAALAVLADIETLAISYDVIDFVEHRKLLGLDK